MHALLTVLWLGMASATDHTIDRAEYVRLASEIRLLSERNAWRGVERAYQAALRTAHPLSFGDHVAGAYAARAVGDAGAVRRRLAHAHRLREDRRVVEWLWRLDHDYGEVALHAREGVALEAVSTAFDPAKVRAVEFASRTLASTGTFEGLLPEGSYHLGGTRFEVRSGQNVAEVAANASRRMRSRRPALPLRVMLGE